MTIVRKKQGRGRPKKIRIPDKFSMLGHEVEVNIVADPEFDKIFRATFPKEKPGNDTGFYSHNLKAIYIRDGLPEHDLYSTYCHELEHCLACFAGRDDLNEDEGYVDLAGELLYQYLTTQRGNQAPKGKYEKRDE